MRHHYTSPEHRNIDLGMHPVTDLALSQHKVSSKIWSSGAVDQMPHFVHKSMHAHAGIWAKHFYSGLLCNYANILRNQRRKWIKATKSQKIYVQFLSCRLEFPFWPCTIKIRRATQSPTTFISLNTEAPRWSFKVSKDGTHERIWKSTLKSVENIAFNIVFQCQFTFTEKFPNSWMHHFCRLHYFHLKCEVYSNKQSSSLNPAWSLYPWLLLVSL